MDIKTCTSACVKGFNTIQRLRDASPDVLIWAEDQEARIRLWANSLGVYAEQERYSVKTKLRQNPTVSGVIVQLLEDLAADIELCLSILTDDEGSSSDGGSEHTEQTDKSDDDDTASIVRAMRDVRQHINRLMRLSNLLRRETATDSYAKAIRFIPRDESGVSRIPEFEASIKFTCQREFGMHHDKPEKEQEMSIAPYLYERIIDTTTQRWQRLSYNIQQRDKLADHSTEEENNQIIPSVEREQLQAHPPLATGQLDLSDLPATSEPIRASVAMSKRSGATTVRDNVNVKQKPSGRTLSAGSVSTRAKATNLDLPKMPVIDATKDEFNCIYCRTLCSRRELRDKWNHHVLADLEPYICLFEDCPSPNITYRSMEAWKAHAMKAHASCTWTCQQCKRDNFTSAQDFTSHLRTHYDVSIMTDKQLSVVAEMQGSRTLPLYDVCPFCDYLPENLGTAAQPSYQLNLFKHIETRHFNHFALMSIPWEAAGSEDGNSSREMPSSYEDADSIDAGNRAQILQDETFWTDMDTAGIELASASACSLDVLKDNFVQSPQLLSMSITSWLTLSAGSKLLVDAINDSSEGLANPSDTGSASYYDVESLLPPSFLTAVQSRLAAQPPPPRLRGITFLGLDPWLAWHATHGKETAVKDLIAYCAMQNFDRKRNDDERFLDCSTAARLLELLIYSAQAIPGAAELSGDLLCLHAIAITKHNQVFDPEHIYKSCAAWTPRQYAVGTAQRTPLRTGVAEANYKLEYLTWEDRNAFLTALRQEPGDWHTISYSMPGYSAEDCLAIYFSHLPLITFILDQTFVSSNTPEKEMVFRGGWSWLPMDSLAEQAGIIQWLEAGMDVHMEDCYGALLLSRAVKRELYQFCAVLLDHGATVSEEDVRIARIRLGVEHTLTRRMLQQLAHQAIPLGKVDVLEEILSSGWIPTEHALELAMTEVQPMILSMLIRAKPKLTQSMQKRLASFGDTYDVPSIAVKLVIEPSAHEGVTEESSLGLANPDHYSTAATDGATSDGSPGLQLAQSMHEIVAAVRAALQDHWKTNATKSPSYPSYSSNPELHYALVYVEQVQGRFQDQAEVYEQFLKLLEDYEVRDLNFDLVIDRVNKLFTGKEDLLQGFSTLLPLAWQIECSSGDEAIIKRVIAPEGVVYPTARPDFRSDARLTALRRLVQQQPELLEPKLQKLVVEDRALAEAIAGNEEDFLAFLAEDIDDDEEVASAGQASFRDVDENHMTIDRLCHLGFERDKVIEALHQHNNNEELAANYLFDNESNAESSHIAEEQPVKDSAAPDISS